MSVTIHFYHQKACNEGFLKLGNLYSKPEQVLSPQKFSWVHSGGLITDKTLAVSCFNQQRRLGFVLELK